MSDNIRMKIIEKPEEGTASVIQKTTPGPVFSGEGEGKGNCNYLCGMCKTVLAKNIGFGQISHLVIQCTKCKRYNQC